MIISVIGSGGKTTKIKQLKDQYLKEGKSVLMTTSTHMKIEEKTLVDPSYEAWLRTCRWQSQKSKN